MPVDSLNELKSAFVPWRSRKKHAREPVPAELRARARDALKMHGVGAVVGASTRRHRGKPLPCERPRGAATGCPSRSPR